jgi:hypothetical protein
MKLSLKTAVRPQVARLTFSLDWKLLCITPGAHAGRISPLVYSLLLIMIVTGHSLRHVSNTLAKRICSSQHLDGRRIKPTVASLNLRCGIMHNLCTLLLFCATTSSLRLWSISQRNGGLIVVVLMLCPTFGICGFAFIRRQQLNWAYLVSYYGEFFWFGVSCFTGSPSLSGLARVDKLQE